ncbi:MAG TPA: hypothetical protein VLQ93_26060 [Myxococcaceae bacterium]|nr:hypothetical protein [Myxococcaceae bacterium]
MRRTSKLRSLAPLAAVGAGGLASYHLAIRPWHLRWGASREELSRPMPGDELVRDPRHVSTRAITIHARPEEVWPWLVQLGMGRAGFYGYRWFERLTELSISTVEHLLPEFQGLEPGDIIPAGRGLHLPVRAVEPNGSLVLGSRPDAPPGEATVSWSLGLYPRDGATRLVSRVRSSYRWKPGAPLPALFLGPLHFVLERKMLLGIKQRAEARSEGRVERPEELLRSTGATP